MAYRVLFLPRAEKEFTEAVGWYESRRKDLGKRFLFCVEDALRSIQDNPLKFPLKRRNFRQLKINVFPYIIIFQVVESDVLIHSVFNTWQNPLKKP